MKRNEHVHELEQKIFAAHEAGNALINPEGFKQVLNERQLLLNAMFKFTEEEVARLKLVNDLFLKYEAKIPELMMRQKRIAELYMEAEKRTSYATHITAGVALLTRSNISLDKHYPSKFEDMFWILSAFSKSREDFTITYQQCIFHPFLQGMIDNEEYKRRIWELPYTQNKFPSCLKKQCLTGITWSQTVITLLSGMYFSLSDILGLDKGQLVANSLEFHSFDTTQYYEQL